MTKPSDTSPDWSFYDESGLSPLINVAGCMSTMGGSATKPAARAAMNDMMPQYVDMLELHAKASAVIAGFCGSEAGFVTACASAGITLGVAATLTGCDLSRIYHLPKNPGQKSEIVIQHNHLCNFGASIRQAIELTGATLVPAGEVNRMLDCELQGALTENTAAGVYVVSHTVAKFTQMSLNCFARICHAAGVAVIVDAAAEQNPQQFIEQGADLVVFSGHKYLGGPTSGIIAGKKDLVRAAFMQNSGIGRGMKVGKESIWGVIAALGDWKTTDTVALRAERRVALELWQTVVGDVPGVKTRIILDANGCDEDRLGLTIIKDQAGASAAAVSSALAAGSPRIFTRNNGTGTSELLFDPCHLKPGQAEIVAARLAEIFAAARNSGLTEPDPDALRNTWETAHLKWPDETMT